MSVQLQLSRRVRLPEPLPQAKLSKAERATVHLLASRLLDYPDAAWFAQLPVIREHVATLPADVRLPFETFLHAADAHTPTAFERLYVETFDLKRKCCLYLTYYGAGDTRRRGTALVSFLDAYRSAGWEFDAAELPDFLPAVLEFSARSSSDVARDLLASHREGIEVLRAALESQSAPWAHVVRAITVSLPPIDAATRERYLALVQDGPPTETVGLSPLLPFTASEEV